jgi:hypothetical protein
MLIKIFRGYENKYLLLETKSANINKEIVTVSSDMVPIFFALVEQSRLPVDEYDIGRVKRLNDKLNELAETYKIQWNSDSLFRVLLSQDYNHNVEFVLTDDEERAKNYVFSDKESEEVREVCLNYKISSITVDGKTYLTTGSIFVMNDDGKTIDRI